MNLAAQIEAILFWKAEPVSVKKIAQLLDTDVKTIKDGLLALETALHGRGVTLVQTEDDVMLGTSKELSPLIEKLTKDELTRDLGKAGLETLSIVLYQGPIARADIDYIRGVNSQFILRALLIRGLVERIDNPKDARSYLYKPTLDLLSHLGISKVVELPEYEKVQSDIESFKSSVTQSTEAADQSIASADATIGA
jgi:segregation and condensation protein B